jgi:acyl-coenzyme A synthetase/AMP-(fatty) acid ligase
MLEDHWLEQEQGTGCSYDVQAFKDIFEREFTYLNGFMRNVHRFKDRPALTCTLRETTWTYAQLNRSVNRLAHALKADGVGKGTVVMQQLLNCAEFVSGFLAPQKLGAIHSPINFRLSPGETAMILDDSRPAVYLYDAEIRDTAAAALAMARHRPERVVMVDIWDKAVPPSGHLAFRDYVQGRSEEDPAPDAPGGAFDEVTRLYTSGTTGLPKGVPLNNINEIMSAHDVIMHFPMRPGDKTMNMSPWFHRGGLHSGGPTPTLYVGGELVVLRHFTQRTCLDYAEKYGVNFLIGAPPMLKLICEAQRRHPVDLSRLKGIVTMGAPLAKEDCVSYLEHLTPNIFNGYGTTETFWNSFLRPADLPAKAGSAGRSCTDDDVAVVKVFQDRRAEPEEQVAQDGLEIGEIIVKCPGKSSYAYIHNPQEAERVFHRGFMYTGDLGVWDDHAFVTIVGRKDDMIVAAGENIHPVQVEEILNQHPKVRESIVTSLPDSVRGQSVVAYVIKADPSLTARELAVHCTGHPMLANYKRPRFCRFVEELPFTATGKKMHFKVREMALEDQAKGLLERM